METLNPTEVSEVVLEFLSKKRNPALFAGAGVAAHAGRPTWSEFMGHLAEVADAYDPLTGDLIRKRTASGHYSSAAAVYKTCPQIPAGEKYRQMVTPFLSPSSPKRLRALVSLPFVAVFTTNYDRSLHDAVASVVGMSPKTVELDDGTMSRAPYFTDFYIARVHGRAEVPESVLLSDDDYQRIQSDECYFDFMRHILTRYSCVFVGFSFVD